MRKREIFGPKKFLSKKFIFPKYKFCQENCINIFGQKNLAKKEFLVQKNRLVQIKKWWSIKGLVLKNFGPNKKFGLKKVKVRKKTSTSSTQALSLSGV